MGADWRLSKHLVFTEMIQISLGNTRLVRPHSKIEAFRHFMLEIKSSLVKTTFDEGHFNHPLLKMCPELRAEEAPVVTAPSVSPLTATFLGRNHSGNVCRE